MRRPDHRIRVQGGEPSSEGAGHPTPTEGASWCSFKKRFFY
jgi:hypothetical protein